jgi:hypothetical protein
MKASGERIPLTGADCFLRAFDYEARRYHGASHLAQLVLRLGPGFDLARFEARLARVMRDYPILRAAIRRPFLVGIPAYHVPPTLPRELPLRVVEVPQNGGADGRAIPAVFFDRLNQRFAIERGDLLRFDVVRYHGGTATDLAMTWAHMLFDASGSEQFITYLAATDQASDAAEGAPSNADGSSWRQQAQVAQRWAQQMVALGDPPPGSLAGPLRTTPLRLRYTLTTLSEADTRTAMARSGRYAGLLTPAMFYLAAALRAHATVFAARGAAPQAYLVPLPVRLAAPDRSGVVIGTHVSLLWFRVLPQHIHDLGVLVEELKRQRLEQIRNRAIEETAAALDFVRLLPLRVYAHMLRRNLRGELSSFVFAFTGELAPALERFAGAEILNAFHAPAVQPSPGSALIMSIRRAKLNITHVYQEGIMSDAERALLHEKLLSDLVGNQNPQ